MARYRRLDMEGVPQHVVARGNNRSSCFFRDMDRYVYLDYLSKAATKCECEIHAYVLMNNHVHLLTTGLERGGVSRMMHRVGTRYARYINKWKGRTGTLFEGRFRSNLVDSTSYLFNCMRYIEANPVRAGMVDHPANYFWSSYRHNALSAPSEWLKPRDEYRGLGATDLERAMGYRAMFDQSLTDSELDEIREHVAKGTPLGDDAFLSVIEGRLGRRLRARARGRPKREK